MIKKTIPVKGMTCSTCARTIENAFKKIENVKIKISVVARKVFVEYDPEKVELESIVSLIKKSGYKPII